MKCPNCGRENPGIRLFCSRCGELLPDSDAPAPAEAEIKTTDDDIKIYKRARRTVRKPARKPGPQPDKPEEVPEDIPEEAETHAEDELFEETDFFTRRERIRRLYEEDWPELTKKAAPRVREKIFTESNNDRPKSNGDSPYARPMQDVRRPPTLTRRQAPETGRPSTLVPRRSTSVDPENLFSVRGEIPFNQEDDYDRAPRRPVRRKNPYEEPENQSFFMRHVRGIVGTILLIVTATIVLTWAFTPNAQLVLARLDLAWSASAYAQLGSEAYDEGSFGTAGRYFNVALAKDADNAGYAISAANSFIQSGETSKAIAAIEKLIALHPDNADYYVTLMGLYGGYENLPDNARALVEDGYERTQDDRLNQ